VQINPKAVKITSLLTQYLYNHHRLDLPGIGTFLLDPSAINALENSKQRSAVLEGISFENNPNLKESPELVAYISAQTGKMKPLAAADLESYIEVAQQFLNIGKPFTFEGIGTLVKVNLKECEFVPISISTDKVREQLNTKETQKAATREEAAPQYESFLSEPALKQGWKKPVIALVLICGLGLTIWGGYAISKKNASKAADSAAIISDTTVVDTATAQTPQTDSLEKAAALANANYKYVLEEASQQRAMKRYKQLRTNLWDVKLETNDSVRYKLYLLLPSQNADTTRVLDSLTVMTGKKVYIEHQN
jgi:glycine cleavage system H lipoate-binding protein